MKLEYRLNINDYYEANQAHFKSQRFRYFTIWGITILCIILGLFYLIIGLLSTPTELLSSCIWLTLGILCNPSFNPLQRYFINRAWKSNPSIREPITIEVTEEEIRAKSSTFESNLKWRIYTHFTETKDLFIVYQSKQIFNIFPKRAFSSDADVEEFRALLHTKLGKSR